MKPEDYGITEDDLKNSEVPADKIIDQIRMFETGFPYVDLVKPAILGDGIFRIPEEKFEHYLLLHKKGAEKGKYTKFVPASGAASRMFHALNAVLSDYDDINIDILNDKINSDKNATQVLKFLNNLSAFAFFDSLKQTISKTGTTYYELVEQKDYKSILEFVLNEKGLKLAKLPKGLIEFHRYTNLELNQVYRNAGIFAA